MHQKAFTLLELIIVIMTLSIIAFMITPNLQRDIAQEAADSILLSLTYTKHLAMIDNKTNPEAAEWQKSLWQIRFGQYGKVLSYTVGSNSDYDRNIDKSESAIDPVNGKYMHYGHSHAPKQNESPRIFLSYTYGIESVAFNACHGTSHSRAKHLAFDHLGRLYRGVTQGASNNFRALVSNKDCILSFTFIDKNIKILKIKVEKETGYSSILE